MIQQTNFSTAPQKIKTMADKGYKTLIDGQLTINAQELKRVLKNAIKTATFVKSGEGLKMAYDDHVYFDFGNKGYLTIMATNGHALYYYKIECPEEWHNKFYFTYHRKDVANICTYLTKIKGNTKLSFKLFELKGKRNSCLLYTSPSPRDRQKSRMPSSA